MKRFISLFTALFLLLSCVQALSEAAAVPASLTVTGSMELEYATQFSVDTGCRPAHRGHGARQSEDPDGGSQGFCIVIRQGRASGSEAQARQMACSRLVSSAAAGLS